ncbi:hypothetical protein FALBO_10839 [Fusarium albosuccineum]|uniref:BZIP domain-containing protein n=1 Tax=Fusarium albosuccineum TaxID=1237068 RepID=A0A8H4L4W5_9HYPO|nr:hypothetical protein FALBO_10839 [Fusarium albosuccineum]
MTTSVSPTSADEEPRPQLTVSPRSDNSFYFFRYFDTFLSENQFTKWNTFSADVLDLMQHPASGPYLRDAVLSLGAMQATKLGSPEGITPNQSYKLAVHHYSQSVVGLRCALNQFSKQPGLRHSILWTTHLLGLFELMSDSTGQGWIQHLVHGTASALVATGPLAFESGPGKRFFLEIRIFEVCRAIVFNEPTFLASVEWQALSAKLEEAADVGQSHPLDTLLDIITLCSTLRVRAKTLICSLRASEPFHLPDEAHDIAAEGFRLRQALSIWKESRQSPMLPSTPGSGSSGDDDFLTLATVFHAATSIYLSGVFDYEMNHWQKMGITVPNLGEDEIQMHVSTILMLSTVILDDSKISPLLVLFPLRIAGARSWEQWQQDVILGLLGKIEWTFPVASTFKGGDSPIPPCWFILRKIGSSTSQVGASMETLPFPFSLPSTHQGTICGDTHSESSASPTGSSLSNQTTTRRKRRAAWGRELPQPRTNIPRRQRAKTADEREQREIERVLRNRRSARNSRERKRLELETLQNRVAELEEILMVYRDMNVSLLKHVEQMGQKVDIDIQRCLLPYASQYSQLPFYRGTKTVDGGQTQSSSVLDPPMEVISPLIAPEVSIPLANPLSGNDMNPFVVDDCLHRAAADLVGLSGPKHLDALDLEEKGDPMAANGLDG